MTVPTMTMKKRMAAKRIMNNSGDCDCKTPATSSSDNDDDSTGR